jgi:hypothetical protein
LIFDRDFVKALIMRNKFFQGVVAILVPLLLLTIGLQLAFTQVGEIDLQRVVHRQLTAKPPGILFLSGINQSAYEYKMLLLDTIKPEIIALGSSRVMQVRDGFFGKSFVNLGGSIEAVPELERAVSHIVALGPSRPALVFVFVDPWWFNPNYSNLQGHLPAVFPKIISADLVLQGLSDLQYGDWPLESLRSENLGIFSVLKKAGFSKDGGYNYVSTIDGETQVDVGFSDEFDRIENGSNLFATGSHPDAAMLGRMCAALDRLRNSVGHLVVIAPPFAGPVWTKMKAGGRYGYIPEAYSELGRCSPGFLDLSDIASVPAARDCEFYDGVHAGNTVAARILRMVGARQPGVEKYLNSAFIDAFILRFSGFAGGMTLLTYPGVKEVDFLRLGCVKRLVPGAI